jgi:hypothetical protein
MALGHRPTLRSSDRGGGGDGGGIDPCPRSDDQHSAAARAGLVGHRTETALTVQRAQRVQLGRRRLLHAEVEGVRTNSQQRVSGSRRGRHWGRGRCLGRCLGLARPGQSALATVLSWRGSPSPARRLGSRGSINTTPVTVSTAAIPVLASNHQCRARPHCVPTAKTSPLHSEAKTKGISIQQAMAAMAMEIPVRNAWSSEFKPITSSTTSAPSRPSHPAEAVTWTVSRAARTRRGRRRTRGT